MQALTLSFLTFGKIYHSHVLVRIPHVLVRLVSFADRISHLNELFLNKNKKDCSTLTYIMLPKRTKHG